MKLITYCFVLLGILISRSLEAQPLSVKLHQYPPHIVLKVRELVSKVTLSEESQCKIADYLLKQDSLASVALKNGLDEGKLNTFYLLPPFELYELLSRNEFIRYTEATYGERSILLIPIKNSKTFSVDDRQVDELLKLLSESDELIRKQKLSRPEWEAEQLKNILSPARYASVKEYLAKKEVFKAVENHMQKLRAAGLITRADRAESYKLLLEYENGKFFAIKKANESHRNADSAIRYAEAGKPLLLYRLNAKEGLLPGSEFANILGFGKQIGLPERTQDSLLACVKTLEIIKLDYRYRFNSIRPDLRTFERTEVFRLLDTIQLAKYLEAKNNKKARQLSDNDWSLLISLKLAAKNDSVKYCKDLFYFHLNTLIKQDKFDLSQIKKDQADMLSFRANKPILFYKLDAFRNSLPGCEYSTILKYRKELTLSEKQADSLLAAVKQLEIIKTDYINHGVDYRLIPYAIQKERINKTLLPDQLEQFFKLKNQQRAIRDANINWQELALAGLGKDYKEEEVVPLIRTSHLKVYTAAERLNWDWSRKNETLKASAEAERPFVLLKLDAAMNRLRGGEIANVIRFKEKIGISASQTDSLLTAIQGLNQLKAKFMENHLTGSFAARNYEHSSITRILTPIQFESYLSYKNLDRISNEAMYVFEKLKSYNIVTQANSKRLYNEVLQYTTVLKLAEDRVYFNASRENVFARLRAQADKPKCMKQLDLAEEKTKNNHFNNLSTW